MATFYDVYKSSMHNQRAQLLPKSTPDIKFFHEHPQESFFSCSDPICHVVKKAAKEVTPSFALQDMQQTYCFERTRKSFCPDLGLPCIKFKYSCNGVICCKNASLEFKSFSSPTVDQTSKFHQLRLRP